MPTAIRIEPMTEADFAATAALDATGHTKEADLRDELARPWARLWVAREQPGGEIVGFLLFWHVVDELHVLQLMTRTDRRRRGIARALMRHAMAYGRENGIARVLLEVRRSNRGAISLYRDTGFFATSVRSRYYPDDEDGIEMLLMLDPASGRPVSHADEVTLE